MSTQKPLKSIPQIWTNRTTLNNKDSWETFVSTNSGMSVNGDTADLSGWQFYAIEAILVLDIPTIRAQPQSTPNDPRSLQFSLLPDCYGVKNRLLYVPKMIRILHNAGYNNGEHYPGTVGGTGSGYSIGCESVYLTPPYVGPGKKESSIDYYNDLNKELIPFCTQNKIGLSIYGKWGGQGTDTSRDWLTSPSDIPSVGHAKGNSDTNYGPVDHPARWLYSPWTQKATPIGVNPSRFGSAKPGGLTGIMDKSMEKYIIGGDLLNIVFVTDGYAAYHGYPVGGALGASSSISSTYMNYGSSNALQEDIDTIKRRSQMFRRWGLIIVCSPKNSQFFPAWVGGDYGVNYGISLCLIDAATHFKMVAAQMGNLNTTLLLRDVGLTAKAPTGTNQPLAQNQWIEFARPQISITEIMQAVHQFWNL
jgi:hypothetical protein